MCNILYITPHNVVLMSHIVQVNTQKISPGFLDIHKKN